MRYNQVPTSAGRPAMSHLKGIAFESPEVQLQKLRERLRQMSDEELIKFAKMVQGNRQSGGPLRVLLRQRQLSHLYPLHKQVVEHKDSPTVAVLVPRCNKLPAKSLPGLCGHL